MQPAAYSRRQTRWRSLMDGATYVIDRFEGPDWAVLEDDRARTFNVPREWLPHGALEGDAVAVREQLVTGEGRTLRFTINTYDRDERLAKAKNRRAALPRGPKGDIAL